MSSGRRLITALSEAVFRVIDFYETPQALADRMVSHAREDVHVVADLAAGSGALLKAARARWKSGPTYLACDADPALVSEELRQLQWAESYELDSLLLEPRATAEIVRQKCPDLILLNPPFSYRGGSYLAVDLGGRSFRVSPAMAFLARSVELVSRAGQVVALLPRNAMMGQRDEGLRNFLYAHHGLECLGFFSSSHFPGVNSSTVIVRLTKEFGPGQPPNWRAPSFVSSTDGAILELFRGRLSPTVARPSRSAEGARYFHTTDLRHTKDKGHSYVISSNALQGFLLLLPRVGYATRDNVRALRADVGVVLSDCVLALRAPDENCLETINRHVIDNLASLRTRYHGSCAPYITVRTLADWLEEGGWNVRVV